MAFAYEDLKAATFHNNPSFVSEWLHRTCAGEKENRDEHQKWMGSLLGLAAYQHSVDVVLCIIDHIGSLDDCKGESFYTCSPAYTNDLLQLRDSHRLFLAFF